jgi:hypothetical protein
VHGFHTRRRNPPASAKRRELARALPLTYGAILVCFLFTFVNISCQDSGSSRSAACNWRSGTTIETPKVFGGSEKKIEPAPLVTFALIAAVAGLIVSFLRRGIAAVAGAAGFVLLLLYKADADGDVLREGGGMIQVDYGGGFIIAVTLFAIAALLGSGVLDRLLGGKN